MINMPRFANPANLVIADDPPKVTKVLKLDALRYLQMVYRGQIEAEGPRMRAAMACLPFETPKLSVVASINDPAAFAERLERAIQRSGIRPLMIEQRVIEHQSKPQPGDVTGPMTGTDRKMRRL
jgi:sulfite reductase beta subunit-like hemoprotein